MKSKCGNPYAGYNDLEREGRFVHPYTSRPVNSSLWADHEPNNFGVGEDCTEVDGAGLLNDIRCNEDRCTVCSLRNNPQFSLRGFCPDQPLDVKYLLQMNASSRQVYPLYGWEKTVLSWSEDHARWEFELVSDSRLVAHCNSTKDYPLGVQRLIVVLNDCPTYRLPAKVVLPRLCLFRARPAVAPAEPAPGGGDRQLLLQERPVRAGRGQVRHLRRLRGHVGRGELQSGQPTQQQLQPGISRPVIIQIIKPNTLQKCFCFEERHVIYYKLLLSGAAAHL